MKKNKILVAILAIVMVLSLAACGKDKSVAPIPTTINGSSVDGAAQIIDSVPMVKGSVVGSDKEYLTLEEVEG